MKAFVFVIECFLLVCKHAGLLFDFLRHVRQFLLQILDVLLSQFQIFLILVQPFSVHLNQPAKNQSLSSSSTFTHKLVFLLLKFVLGLLQVCCYFGDVVVLRQCEAAERNVLADFRLLDRKENDSRRQDDQPCMPIKNGNKLKRASAPMMTRSFLEKMTCSAPAGAMRGALADPMVGPSCDK